MSVKIRLMRVGKKKQPTYRVVVADERSPRDGRIIETIGHYGPRADPSVLDIDGDKALDWLRKGAQPSEAVQKLLTVSGVWATFEGEKAKPIVTKLNRRGYATGKVVATKRTKKSEAAPEAEAGETTEAPTADTGDSDAEGAAATAASADAATDTTEQEEADE